MKTNYTDQANQKALECAEEIVRANYPMRKGLKETASILLRHYPADSQAVCPICNGSKFASVGQVCICSQPIKADSQDWKQMAVDAIDALRHMEFCAVCAEGSWYNCDGGHKAKQTLATFDAMMKGIKI